LAYIELLQLFVALVKQHAQEILGILLLIVWVVCPQEIFENKFSVDTSVTVWLIELVLVVQVFLDGD
jgi:hypothetical protein